MTVCLGVIIWLGVITYNGVIIYLDMIVCLGVIIWLGVITYNGVIIYLDVTVCLGVIIYVGFVIYSLCGYLSRRVYLPRCDCVSKLAHGMARRLARLHSEQDACRLCSSTSSSLGQT